MSNDGFGYVEVENGKIKVVSGSHHDEIINYYENDKIVNAVKLQEIMKKRMSMLEETANKVHDHATIWSLHNTIDEIKSLIKESEK